MWRVKGVGEAPDRKGRSQRPRIIVPEEMGDNMSNVGMERVKGRGSAQGVGRIRDERLGVFVT
jgi:hypothetical protein